MALLLVRLGVRACGEGNLCYGCPSVSIMVELPAVLGGKMAELVCEATLHATRIAFEHSKQQQDSGRHAELTLHGARDQACAASGPFPHAVLTAHHAADQAARAKHYPEPGFDLD